MYAHRYTTFSSGKLNNAPLSGEFYGYHHHQNGLGHMLKPPNESFETSDFWNYAHEFLSSCFTL